MNRRSLPWLLLAPALLCVVFLVVLPVFAIGIYSFQHQANNATLSADLTLENWREYFADLFFVGVLGRTLVLAAVSTVICAVVSYPVAYLISRSPPRLQSILLLALLLPSWISYLVRTMSWLHVLGPQGVVNSLLLGSGLTNAPLPLLYNDFSIYMGLIHYLLPIMTINIYIGLQAVESNVVAAARVLGASEFQAFRSVTFPISFAGVSAGALLCFMLAAGSYLTPVILGGPGSTYYSELVYSYVIRQVNWPLGAAVSLVFIFVLGLLLVLYRRLFGSITFNEIK